MLEPELITVVEGPTPDFRPSHDLMVQSVLEGPMDSATAICEMRTANGHDIRQRCLRAWRERRPVLLDFPDEMRLRQQVEVVAMRLNEVEEGAVLVLWVRWPMLLEEEDDEDDFFEDYFEDDYYDDEEAFDEGEFDDGDDEFYR